MKMNLLPEQESDKEQKIHDFFSQEADEQMATIAMPAQKGHFSITKLIIILAIAFTVIFAGLWSAIAFSRNQVFDGLSKMNFFGQVGQLITSQDKRLQGEETDRINVLLIGRGGENHEGGTLADTIIMASIKPSTQQVAMMSVPRDLYVKSPDFGWLKVNGVSAYAEKKEEGSGGPAMAKLLSDTMGQEILYYVVIDFDGFEKLIDDLGGIDVMVDNDLIDYQYPIRGREDAYPISSRFETLNIKKGLQHFDGATALKYARSRHGLGSEGSDFARSRRQQKILTAVKDKALSAGTLTSPGKISSLLSAYNMNIQTNLQLWEMLRIYNLAKDVSQDAIIHQQLDDSPAGMLYSNKINGAYVLLPDGGSFAKIRTVWQNVFTASSTDFAVMTTADDAGIAKEIKRLNEQAAKDKEAFKVISSTPTTTTATSTAPVETTTVPVSENPSIEILNGTFIAGWASTEKSILEAKGLKVVSVGNAPTRDYSSVHIYDLSGGKYPSTAAKLADTYGVAVSKSGAPADSDADFLVVLGKKSE